MRSVIPLVLVTFCIFFFLVMMKQEQERQIRIKVLTKESERLDKVRDSLLDVRDKSMSELDSLVNVMNNIK